MHALADWQCTSLSPVGTAASRCSSSTDCPGNRGDLVQRLFVPTISTASRRETNRYSEMPGRPGSKVTCTQELRNAPTPPGWPQALQKAHRAPEPSQAHNTRGQTTPGTDSPASATATQLNTGPRLTCHPDSTGCSPLPSSTVIEPVFHTRQTPARQRKTGRIQVILACLLFSVITT
jgi:hypothetical protein